MVNKRKLLSIAVLNGYTQNSLAKAIKMGENTLGRKLNGRSSFGTNEIEAICDVLKITDPYTKAEIFLALSSPTGNENPCLSEGA